MCTESLYSTTVQSREVGWVSCRAHLIHEKKKKRNIWRDETISLGFHSQKKIGIWNWNSDSYTENPFCYVIEEMLKCSLNRELGKGMESRRKERGLASKAKRRAGGMVSRDRLRGRGACSPKGRPGVRSHRTRDGRRASVSGKQGGRDRQTDTQTNTDRVMEASPSLFSSAG